MNKMSMCAGAWPWTSSLIAFLIGLSLVSTVTVEPTGQPEADLA